MSILRRAVCIGATWSVTLLSARSLFNGNVVDADVLIGSFTGSAARDGGSYNLSARSHCTTSIGRDRRAPLIDNRPALISTSAFLSHRFSDEGPVGEPINLAHVRIGLCAQRNRVRRCEQDIVSTGRGRNSRRVSHARR